MSRRILLFVGKGGVGKSTSSSLFAVKLARAGKSVLLNSIDPAHNLRDIFRTPLGARPREIVPGLEVMETDLKAWVKKYLRDTERELRSVYRYQEAFSLQRYFRILRYAPGLEEYAVLLAMSDTVTRFEDREYILFDTPPTALTLRFLALPAVSLLWLRELSRLRELILKKKEIVSRIRAGGKRMPAEADPVLARLGAMTGTWRDLDRRLKDPELTRVFCVVNPDELSLAESRSIREELGGLDIPIPYIILNRHRGEDEAARRVQREFPDSRLLLLPARDREITGLERLEALDLPLEVEEI